MRVCAYCESAVHYQLIFSKQQTLYGCPRCLNVNCLTRDEVIPTTARIETLTDVRESAPEGSVIAGILNTARREIEHLPVLPQTPQRVINLIHDPLAGVQEVSDLIGEDSALSVKVLNIANSAYYSGVEEVTDLKYACARLGLKAIAQIMHSVAFRSVFRARDKTVREAMRDLWHHSLLSAHAAEELSRRVTEWESATPFVAGLTHAIGKAVLLDVIGLKHKGNLGRLRDDRKLLDKALGRWYPLVGLHVIQYWRLAPELLVTTYFHGRPEANPDAKWHSLVAITGAASRCAQRWRERGAEMDVRALNDLSGSGLRLNVKDWDDFHSTLCERMEAADSVLELI